MYYNELCGEKVSALGFGAMRLPEAEVAGSGGADAGDGGAPAKVIDQAAVEQMVDYALAHGVNYFDTAWGYHGGKSEVALGEALAKHDRSSYFLTDKFPGYDVSNFGKHEQIFDQQLERCGVERFDFYLFHNVCELNIEQYLAEDKFHTAEFLASQREAGRIGHLGFSAHGSLRTIQRFVRKFGDILEFAQLQVNWMDWDFQDAGEKVAYLKSLGLPIIVMEPLRGGRLVNLDDQSLAELEKLCSGQTAAEWSFRYLQGIEGLPVALSGMSNMQQLQENIAIYGEHHPLDDAQGDALMAIGERLASKDAVPCTRCSYCVTHCDYHLNIPELLALYNEHMSTGGKGFIAPMALGSMKANRRPEACVGCRSCEYVCPQEIKISEIFTKMKNEISVF